MSRNLGDYQIVVFFARNAAANWISKVCRPLWGRSDKGLSETHHSMPAKDRPIFRAFRSPKRDAQTDLVRSEKVVSAVMEGLSSLEAEIVGLGLRVEELRAWAGGLIDSESSSASQRGRSAENDLLEAEQQLLKGVERQKELEGIHKLYRELLNIITAERERSLQSARAGE